MERVSREDDDSELRPLGDQRRNAQLPRVALATFRGAVQVYAGVAVGIVGATVMLLVIVFLFSERCWSLRNPRDQVFERSAFLVKALNVLQ